MMEFRFRPDTFFAGLVTGIAVVTPIADWSVLLIIMLVIMALGFMGKIVSLIMAFRMLDG